MFCQKCGAKMEDGTKFCPECGAPVNNPVPQRTISEEVKPKKKKSIGKKILSFFLILIGIFIVIGAIGGRGNKEPTKVESETKVEAPTATKEPEKTEFYVGDTADFNGIQVKLSSAILSKGDGSFIKPEDGNHYLGLIFDIVNNSSKDIAISSLMSFEAYCDDYSTNLDIIGQQAPEWDGLNQLDGSVAAGKRMNGIIVYQVPVDFKEFEITVKPDFWNNKEVTFIVPADMVDASSIG